MCGAKGVRCHAGRMMEIIPRVEDDDRRRKGEKAIQCHILFLHVMFILFCILYCDSLTVAL